MNDYTLDLLFPTPVYKTNIGLLTDAQWDYVKNQNYTPRVTGTHGRDDTNVLDLDLFLNLISSLFKYSFGI